MKKSTTKRALFMSFVSMFLCFTMLLGTTYAWFTDSVTSGVNTIVSGNLDVELEYWDGTAWTTVQDSDELFDKDAKWEPGYTDVVYLRLKNAGDLALKYQFGVNIVSEKAGTNKAGDSFNLSDYVMFDVVGVNGNDNGPEKFADRAASIAAVQNEKQLATGYTTPGVLYAKDNLPAGGAFEEYVALIAYMPTTVGDAANYKTSDEAGNPNKYAPVINLGIKLLATQIEAESDSFGDDYDANSPWVGGVNYSWYDPDATEFTIFTADQLAAVAALVDGTAVINGVNVNDDFANNTIKLGNDISLFGLDWAPIGTQANGFKGTFDGQGYTVSDFVVEKNEYAGLFGYALNGGNIKNLTVKNATILAMDRAGAVIGAGYTDLLNCHAVDCKIVATPELQNNGVYDGGAKAGGVIGQMFEGAGNTVAECTATNVSVIGYRDIGGVLGMAHSQNVVTDCATYDSEVAYMYLPAGATYDSNTPNENAGAVVGRISSSATVTGSVSDNVDLGSIYVYGLKLTLNANSQNYGTITVSDKEDLFNLAVLDENWDTLFTDGNGTDYSNYPINNYYYDWTWNIVLTNNIDFCGAQIQPIDLGKRLVFDGQGHTINNAVILADSTIQNNIGLFDASECGVKNLKLDNIKVTGSNVGDSSAGVLSGSCNCPIDNVAVTNSSVIGGKYTGGVVGYGYTSITNCTVENVVVKGGYKLGGLIGYICASNADGNDVTGNTLSDCTVDGIGGGVYAGGKTQYIVGKVVGNYNCNGDCNNNTVNNITTSATENIGKIEAGKTVNQ